MVNDSSVSVNVFKLPPQAFFRKNFFRALISALLVSFACKAPAQIAPSKFLIHFTDKNNSPFSVSAPSAFLSQKAIDRRTKQNIAVQQNDIPVNPFYADSVQNIGVVILNRSKWFNAITIDTTGVNDSLALVKILSFPFVSGIEPTGKLKKLIPVAANKWDIENVSAAPLPGGMPLNIYGQSYNQISMVGGDILHALGYRGEGMVVAVIDAGFSNADILPAFDSARVNNRILGTRDFVNMAGNVYNYAQHGTNVFSIMACNLPGQMIGTAPHTGYFLLRTEDTGSEYIIEEDNWVAAAEYADSAGADILSTSLGYSTFDNPAQNHTYADMNGNTTRISVAADIAASKGMLVVNAAGNAAGGSWQYILAPADGDSVMAVGAVDAAGMYASFSSTGPTSDGRIKPNVAAQGALTIVASASGGIAAGSGTSFAAPIIAGMSACLWQANPTASAMEVFNAILQSASRHNNPDTLTGYGIPNFAAANLILRWIPLDNDQDKDGVPDIYDKCPETPHYLKADPSGCPVLPATDEVISVFFNPPDQALHIIFNSSASQTITLELLDLPGRTILISPYTLANNSSNTLIFGRSLNLPQGIYFIRITTPVKTYVVKFARM